MVLVLDMDDTLYYEQTYVHSGFRAVAGMLSEKFGVNDNQTFKELCEVESKHGRGKVFNLVLEQFGLLSKKNIQRCISTYRGHTPTISLAEDAVRLLERFKNLRLFVVTDGNKFVQERKVKALGLQDRIEFAYITYRYGLNHSKPSPYCFQLICKRCNVSPEEVLYIGDNPKKDFVGIKPLGFKTVQILRGPYQSLDVQESHKANYCITSLDEVNEDFLESL